MLRAWAFQTPSAKALLLAAESAPVVALAVLHLSTRGEAPYTASEVAGLGLLLVAYVACFRWMGIARSLLSRRFHLFLWRTIEASALGLGLAWLAFLLFPALSPGYAEAAVVGAFSAGILVAARPLLALAGGPRTMMDGVLVLGRQDLAGKLCLDLLARDQIERLPRIIDLPPVGRGQMGGRLDPARLAELVERERISRIIVAEPDVEAEKEITAALFECRFLGVEVEHAAELYQRLHGKLWLEALDPARLAFADGFRLTALYLRLKRVIDVACALLLLVLAAPLAAVIALAVRLESRGPILFRQERVGQFGKPFTLFKFRSMREDAEQATGPTWAQENDSRVTRVGRILRKTHLDEIPQALNVLRGDLSFVGPRPERACFVEMLSERIPFFRFRLYVKPGITGWAQVRYPYAGSVQDSYEKLQYDLYYAKNVSLALDLKILLLTALTVVLGRGR